MPSRRCRNTSCTGTNSSCQLRLLHSTSVGTEHFCVVRLAAEYGLRLLYHSDFHTVFMNEQETPEFAQLLSKMKVMNKDGSTDLTGDQWEATSESSPRYSFHKRRLIVSSCQICMLVSYSPRIKVVLCCLFIAVLSHRIDVCESCRDFSVVKRFPKVQLPLRQTTTFLAETLSLKVYTPVSAVGGGEVSFGVRAEKYAN